MRHSQYIIEFFWEIYVRKRKKNIQAQIQVFKIVLVMLLLLDWKILLFVGIYVPRSVASNVFWFNFEGKLIAFDDFLVTLLYILTSIGSLLRFVVFDWQCFHQQFEKTIDVISLYNICQKENLNCQRLSFQKTFNNFYKNYKLVVRKITLHSETENIKDELNGSFD